MKTKTSFRKESVTMNTKYDTTLHFQTDSTYVKNQQHYLERFRFSQEKRQLKGFQVETSTPSHPLNLGNRSSDIHACA